MTESSPSRDTAFWIIGCILGAIAGYTHVRVQDSSLSVLMVTAFTMFLAICRPERVWRWALIIGISLPIAAIVAFLSREKPSRGMLWGTFAGFAFSIVAAVGGMFFRRVIGILFSSKS